MKRKRILHFNEYTAVIVITILLICQTAFSYYFFQSQNISSYNGMKSMLLRQQRVRDETIDNSIAQLAATLAGDSGLLMLLQNGKVQPEQQSDIFRQFRRYLSFLSDVSNVYVFHDASKTVYDAAGGIFPLERFPARTVSEELSRPVEERQRLVIDSFVGERGIVKNHLYYLYPVDNTVDHAIIIERNYEEWMRAYDECQSMLKGKLIVATEDGRSVYGGGDFDIGQNLRAERLFQMRGTDQEAVIEPYHENKSLLSYEHSRYSGLWYISVTPYYQIVNDTLFRRQYLYIYISLIISGLVILRVFTWFKRVRVGIVRSRRAAGNSRNTPLNDAGETSLALLDYMLKPSAAGVGRLLETLPYDFRADMLTAVMIVRLDNADRLMEEHSLSDVQLYRYGMANIIEELFRRNGFHIYCVNETEREFCYLLGDGSAEDFRAGYRKTAELCGDELLKYIGVITSYFVSGTHKVDALDVSYEQALAVRKYQYLYGKNVILDDKCIVVPDESAAARSNQLCEALKQAITEVDGERQRECFDTLFNSLRNMNIELVHETLLRLWIAMHEALGQLRRERKLDLSVDAVNAIEFIGRAESLEEIRSYFLTLLETAGNWRRLSGGDKLTLLMERCMSLIDNNYSDPELCVESIANKVGLSANYLGRKFKEYAGITVADVINQKRLEKAAELLVQSNDSVKTIVTKVGFASTSYFSVVFKKRYNCPPSAYRQFYKK